MTGERGSAGRLGAFPRRGFYASFATRWRLEGSFSLAWEASETEGNAAKPMLQQEGCLPG